MTGDRDVSDRNAARAERKQRLAATLRENLKRRRAQARGRAADAGTKLDAEKSTPSGRREGAD
jgi:hypothetical protein